MTLPFERTRAILAVREWMLNLATTPGRINKTKLQKDIYALLKHYPTRSDMDRIDDSVALREVFVNVLNKEPKR